MCEEQFISIVILIIYGNQCDDCDVLLQSFKNPEVTREQEEAFMEKNLAFAPQ